MLRVAFNTFNTIITIMTVTLTVWGMSTAIAQTYPNRAVRMLIPFTVGSAADVIARAMEPALRERLGQPLVIDNRAGAGGNIAAELKQKAHLTVTRFSWAPSAPRPSTTACIPSLITIR